MKSYIHQLRDGKMLVLEDSIIKVEETGYPLPACSFKLGDKEFKGQEKVLKLIMGYSFDLVKDFIDYALTIEELSLDEFKLKVQSENIGGGCPSFIQKIAKNCIEENIDWTQSSFKHLIPNYYLKDNYILPSSQDIIDEYGDLIQRVKPCKVNNPNSIFKNNIIMWLGLRGDVEKYISLFKDCLDCLADDFYIDVLKYITVITAENGTNAVLFLDSVQGSVDLEYFYSKIIGVDLSESVIEVTDTTEGIEISCDTSEKVFKGTVKHYRMEDFQ